MIISSHQTLKEHCSHNASDFVSKIFAKTAPYRKHIFNQHIAYVSGKIAYLKNM